MDKENISIFGSTLDPSAIISNVDDGVPVVTYDQVAVKLSGTNYRDRSYTSLETKLNEFVVKEGSKVLSDVNFSNALNTKLSSIEENANCYVLPKSSPGTLGGVCIENNGSFGYLAETGKLGLTVDSSLNANSTNPVQNKAICNEISKLRVEIGEAGISDNDKAALNGSLKTVTIKRDPTTSVLAYETITNALTKNTYPIPEADILSDGSGRNGLMSGEDKVALNGLVSKINDLDDALSEAEDHELQAKQSMENAQAAKNAIDTTLNEIASQGESAVIAAQGAKLNELEGTIDDVAKNIMVYKEQNIVIEQKVYSTNMTETQGSNYRGSRISGVKEGDEFIVSCSSLNTTFCACFVRYALADGSNRNIVILYGADNRLFVNEHIIVPKYDGTKEVLSAELYLNGTFQVMKAISLKAEKLVIDNGAYPNFYHKLQNADKDISKNKEDINAIKNSITVYAPTGVITEGQVTAADLVLTNGNQWQTAKIENVNIGDKFRVTCSSINTRFPACFAIYWFHDNTKYAKTILYGEDNKLYFDEDIVIPEYTGSKIVSSIDLYINGNITSKYLNKNISLGSKVLCEDVVQNLLDENFAFKKETEDAIQSRITKVPGQNLYNLEKDVDGFLLSNGDVRVSGTWKTTDYIDLKDVAKVNVSCYNLTISKRAVGTFAYLCTYDENKNFIKQDTAYNNLYIYFKEDDVRYIRFSYQTNVSTDIQVEEGEIRTEDYIPYIEYDAFVNPKPMKVDDELGKEVVCCIGDSLTWGHLGKDASGAELWQSANPYPQVLQEHLGDRYLVKNFGIPGAMSPCISGSVTAFEAMEDVTIPNSSSQSVYIKMKFLRDISTNKATQFGAVLSPYGTDGGVNPIVINGVKCNVRSSILLSGDTVYSAYIRRLDSGDPVNVKQGDLIMTNAGEKYKNTPHIIFMGANGGWFVDGTSSIHSNGNIEELIEQIEDVIRVSNKQYIVMSYWAWLGTSTPEWEGESKFAEKFGYHYLNLRKYFAEQAIDDAIAKGYMDAPTEDDRSAMAQGKIPPSFLNPNRNDIHMCDLGYKVLGDVVWQKYQEVYKRNILGK